MKILFLVHSLNIGGIETYLLRFINWLKKKYPCNELHVICKSGKFGPYETDYRNAEVRLHSIKLGYFNIFQYLNFCAFLRRYNFDVICDFSGDFSAIIMICGYAAKVSRRLVFYRNSRNAYVKNFYKDIYQLIQNNIVRIFSTSILSNSKEAFDYYFKDHPIYLDKRFKIIPNGIPVINILTEAEKTKIRQSVCVSDKKIVLHVGSGRWEKNHKYILNIAKIFQENDENVLFCLVGPNVERNYGKMARKISLNNIKFLGSRRDIDELLQVADVFIFPSLSEGQPNALLEAITCNLPFIASNISPIKELLSTTWGDRWLFSPDKIEQGYLLLKEHLNNNFRHNHKFKELVIWCTYKYDENKCFDEFLTALTSPPNS